MEFGLFLATIDFATVRESARTAEELGYDLVVGRGTSSRPYRLAKRWP